MMRVRRTRCASRRSPLPSSAAWPVAARGGGGALARVAGGGVAELVGDVGGEAAERGELELLRLLARARGVLEEQHPEHLLGAGVEQAHAQAAAAHGGPGG